MKSVHLTVAEEGAGERLDRWLAARVEGLSRGLARRILQEGGVFVAGRRVRVASRPVRPGEEVVVHIPSRELLELRWPEPRIVHRDPILLVADKVPGRPVQPTRTGDYGSLETALGKLLRGDGVVVRALHRLDAGTSGLVAFTLEPPSARGDVPRIRQARKALRRLFREHRVERIYRAVTVDPGPSWPEGEEREVDLPLVRRGRGVHAAREGEPEAKRASTLLRLHGRRTGPGGMLAVVTARPRTGRLHQVRAHLAAAGLRLVGEERYVPEGAAAGQGEGLPELSRPALHAWRLELEHPLGGRVALESPLPPDLAALLGEER